MEPSFPECPNCLTPWLKCKKFSCGGQLICVASCFCGLESRTLGTDYLLHTVRKVFPNKIIVWDAHSCYIWFHVEKETFSSPYFHFDITENELLLYLAFQ